MRCLVTAALPYINNVPHLGHIVGSHLPADIIARYLRMKGNDVLFVGGSDESGTTSEIAAREAGMPIADFCGRLHAVHKRIYEWFEISYDIYSQTTLSPEHHATTREMFERIMKNGFITEGVTEQLYCPVDRRFLADRFVQGTCPHCAYPEAWGDQCEKCGHFLDPKLLKDPRCKLCGAVPELKTSKHLFLRLDALAPKLQAWIEASTNWRSQVRSVALGWIKEGLRERMVTRDLDWGVKVPFPGYEDKVFYVWFDAPIGYLSFTRQLVPDRWQEFWRDPQARIYHVLGKDNIAFHTIFWPGMLMADGTFNLPYRVDGEQFLNYEGGKFSKSKKHGIFCEKLPEAGIDVDVLRAYLVTLIPETADTEWKWEQFEERTNGELINNIANFFHRWSSLCVAKCGGELARPAEPTDLDRALLAALKAHVTRYDELLEAGELRAGWSELLALSTAGNKYLAETAPWKLVKTDVEATRRVFYLCATIAKALASLLAPYTPAGAERAWKMIGLDGRACDPKSYATAAEMTIPDRHKLGEPKPLFAKLTAEEVARLKAIVTEPTDLGALLGKAACKSSPLAT